MSELSDSIHRQRWGDLKGHSGRERIVMRNITKDRIPYKKQILETSGISLTEFQLTYDSKGLQKWLRSG